MNSWAPSRAVEKVKRNNSDSIDALSSQDTASQDYPSVKLPTGECLHIFQMDGEWEVWLNTEVSDFDGICVGSAVTRDEAVAAAVEVFEAALDRLQQPA
jgi:hypothetical protein